MTDFGYMQHGQAGSPMRTERVKVKCEHSDRWLAFFEGKWRRVYIQLNSTHIIVRGTKITVLIEGV